MDIIFTTYFTKKLGFSQHDSSHGGKGGSRPDDYSLMKKWYESILKIGINAIIFHNECSKEFINRYSTDKLKFVKYDKSHRPSYNDERFFCFYEYLKKNENIKRVLWTDMFDVVVFKNPFELFSDKYHLYCGSEEKNVHGSFGRKWINKKMRLYKFPLIDKNEMVYNAGCCGANRKTMLGFLKKATQKFDKIGKNQNANMAVFNQTIRELKSKGWKVFTGHPLHNVFESNKVKEGVYIKHK